MFLSNVKNCMSPFAHTFDICVFRCLPLHPTQTEKIAVSRQTEGSVIIYFGIFSQLLNIITHRQFLTLPPFARRLVHRGQSATSLTKEKWLKQKEENSKKLTSQIVYLVSFSPGWFAQTTPARTGFHSYERLAR